jgi:hypothetical protein
MILRLIERWYLRSSSLNSWVPCMGRRCTDQSVTQLGITLEAVTTDSLTATNTLPSLWHRLASRRHANGIAQNLGQSNVMLTEIGRRESLAEKWQSHLTWQGA